MTPADTDAQGPHEQTAARPAARSLMLGVDIGTTSTKVVAFDGRGRLAASHATGYPLEEPHPGHAVQDPGEITRAVS